MSLFRILMIKNFVHSRTQFNHSAGDGIPEQSPIPKQNHKLTSKTEVLQTPFAKQVNHGQKVE